MLSWCKIYVYLPLTCYLLLLCLLILRDRVGPSYLSVNRMCQKLCMNFSKALHDAEFLRDPAYSGITPENRLVKMLLMIRVVE